MRAGLRRLRDESVKLALFAAGVVVALAGRCAWPASRAASALRALVEAFETGAKYALAVGAAAATVGIVIGVVTLTGVGFKISFIITSAAQTIAGGVATVLPAVLMSTPER